MANIFVEGIINQTLQNSFGGNVTILKDTLLKNSHLPVIALGQALPGHPASEQDDGSDELSIKQFDSMTQALQNVEMGQYERLFWIIIFSLMVLVAAGGNVIVVYIVSTNREMKSVTNYFLVNLSIADTMVSTLNVIFNFLSMLISHWPFGLVYCKISNFIAILSISASVFTLTAISCDRYNAILHPLRPRMSHSHALGWILLIWTLSSALALPNAIYSTLLEDRPTKDSSPSGQIICTMIWPDGRYPFSSHDHIYNIMILVVTYFVPIVTMAILYYKVGKELWGSEAIGENIDKPQQRALMAKKKIVKMMIVVVIIFTLCWLPYHAFFVVNYYIPTIFQDGPLQYQRYYLLMYWLAMSNSMYNPIIIYFMNSNYRREFKKILLFICCCRVYTPVIRSTTMNTKFMNNRIAQNTITSATKRQLAHENHHQTLKLINNDNHHIYPAAQKGVRSSDTVLVAQVKINHPVRSCFESEITDQQSVASDNKQIDSGTTGEEEPFVGYDPTRNKHRNDLNSASKKLIGLPATNGTIGQTNLEFKVWI